MKKPIFLLFCSVVLCLASCAKKGRPTGGPKDEDAPIFIIADPPYETTDFDENEIELEFNEYIKLRDVNKQLVISPPPKNRPVITPQGSASKYIKIKILDTLLPNTTYTFDFGNSVEDNNEGNKLKGFKYVFSTGKYIDSLELSGSVKSAYKNESLKNIKLILHKIDTSYSDSTVFKKKPFYVTSTLDTSNYKFTNLKEGKYFLFALQDVSDDYIFDPRNDEIGFYKDTIVLPRDSIITSPIALSKQELPYTFRNGKEVRKGQILFGYEGKAENLKTTLLSDVPEDFKTIVFKEKGKDTLNLWHSPIERDSLVFKVESGNQIDTAIVRLRKKKLDSLIVTPEVKGNLEFKDTLLFSTNNPIVRIDTTKILFLDADTLAVPYTSFLSKKERKMGFLFEKKPESKYSLEIYPDAFTDIFNQANDSLKVNFRTKKLEAYGDFGITLNNPKNIPVIVELFHSKDQIEERVFASSSQTISFQYLRPKKYTIRVIYDRNNNGKWDPGDVLKKIQPEKVEYFFKDYEVRANFSNNEIITIND